MRYCGILAMAMTVSKRCQIETVPGPKVALNVEPNQLTRATVHVQECDTAYRKKGIYATDSNRTLALDLLMKGTEYLRKMNVECEGRVYVRRCNAPRACQRSQRVTTSKLREQPA